MISISQIVVLALFAATAQAQIRSTAELDTKFALNHQNLMGAEANINSAFKGYLNQINEIMIKTTNGSDIQIALAQLALTVTVFSTIDSHVVPEKTVTCDDVNLKILSTELNSRVYMSISKQISTNSSILNRVAGKAQSIYMKSRKTLDTSIPSLRRLLTNTKTIVNAYNNYRQLLMMTISDEKKIISNLNAYKRLYCTCPSAISSAGATQVSTLESNVAKVQGTLVAKQTELQTALKNIKTSVTVGNTLVTSAKLKPLYQTISEFATTQSTVDVYVNITINSTSCSEVDKRIANTKYMVSSYKTIQTTLNTQTCKQILSFSTKIETTTRSENKTFVNITAYAAAQVIVKQAVDLKKICESYKSDLTFAIQKLNSMTTEIKALKDSYCKCQSGSTTPTTTTTTEETTPAEETPETEETTPETEATTPEGETTESTTPATTKNPNCAFEQVITDSAGAYVKTACSVETNGDYATAKTTCSGIGMVLFKPETQEDIGGIQSLLVNYPSLPNLWFYVLAIRENGAWAIDDGSGSAVATAANIPANDGEVLQIGHEIPGTIAYRAIANTDSKYALCQFDKNAV